MFSVKNDSLFFQNTKLLIKASLFGGLLTVLPSVSQAGTYYVSPTGTAGWSECVDMAKPCSAATGMQNAVAGDTVYFRGGKYELYYDSSKIPEYYWYRGMLSPSHSGTATNPIIFSAFPGETPVLNAHVDSAYGTESARAIGNGDQDYITFDGFTLTADDGVAMGGIIITGYNISRRVVGNTIKNCIINGGTNTITSTDNKEGIRLEQTTGTHIQNCKLYNFRQVTDWPNTAAIKMYFNDYVLIENTEIFNATAGIYLKTDVDNSTFRNNFIHNSVKAIYGQVYLDRSSDFNKVYNNVIVNNSYGGVVVTQEEVTSHANGWEVYNNTLYNNVNSISSANGEWRIWNNIIANSKTLALATSDGTLLVESDHNNFGASVYIDMRHWTANSKIYTSLASWQSSGELQNGSNPGTGSRAEDPKFANSSGNMDQLNDFQLGIGSTSLNSGRSNENMGANINTVGYTSNLVLPKPPVLR